MHSVPGKRKQWQKQYIATRKTDLFRNSMGLYGNFTERGMYIPLTDYLSQRTACRKNEECAILCMSLKWNTTHTKDMKFHVLVNEVLKLNDQPLENSNPKTKKKIVLVYKLSTCFVSRTAFLITRRKLNRPPLKEGKGPRFRVIRNEQTDWCLLADTTFWPLYRVCIKTYLHTILPFE